MRSIVKKKLTYENKKDYGNLIKTLMFVILSVNRIMPWLLFTEKQKQSKKRTLLIFKERMFKFSDFWAKI